MEAIEGLLAASKNRGPLFGRPYNESPTIWGSILGPLIFGISHIEDSSLIKDPSPLPCSFGGVWGLRGTYRGSLKGIVGFL